MAQSHRTWAPRATTALGLVCIFVIGLVSTRLSQDVLAQAAQSPTPLRAQIGSTATQGLQLNALPSPTFTPTATPQQTAFLEAKAEAVNGVNVRAAADPEADILGVIRAGEQYVVTGRYYLWLRFRYDRSPSGQGWVFSDLVNLSGDTTLIPDLAAEPQATMDATVVGATQTAEVTTLTPGAPLTATAEANLLLKPVSVNDAASGVANASGLPTFTPPPELAVVARASNVSEAGKATKFLESAPQSIDDVAFNNVPRILPIVLLGGLGILGLLISLLRR